MEILRLGPARLRLILIESDSFRTRARPRPRKAEVREEVTRYTFEDEYEDDDEDEKKNDDEGGSQRTMHFRHLTLISLPSNCLGKSLGCLTIIWVLFDERIFSCNQN